MWTVRRLDQESPEGTALAREEDGPELENDGHEHVLTPWK